MFKRFAVLMLLLGSSMVCSVGAIAGSVSEIEKIKQVEEADLIKDQRPLKIVLLGTPGSGKTTQANLLQRRYNIPIIEMKELLKNVLQENSMLSRSVVRATESGKKASHQLLTQVLKRRVEKDDCKDGFILDGYPETLKEARALDTILHKFKGFTKIIYLDMQEAELTKRMENIHLCATKCKTDVDLRHTEERCNHCDGTEEIGGYKTVSEFMGKVQEYKDSIHAVFEHYSNRANFVMLDVSHLDVADTFAKLTEEIEKKSAHKKFYKSKGNRVEKKNLRKIANDEKEQSGRDFSNKGKG